MSSLVGRLQSQSVLLGTALIHMRDYAYVLHMVRALIDKCYYVRVFE